MNPSPTLIALLGAVGVVVCVLYGAFFFRAAVAWLGISLGALWGASLGGMAVGGVGGVLGGAVLGAALLGALATTAERGLVALLGGLAFWTLSVGLGSAAGLGGSTLALVGVGAAILGAVLVIWMHEAVVAVAVAVWGTGFLRLGDLLSGHRVALPRDAWLNAPELLVGSQLGPLLRDGSLRALVLLGFVGLAALLARLDAQVGPGSLSSRRLRRLGLLCAALAALPLLGPLGLAMGWDRQVPWLSLPREALGLGPATWPAGALLCWLLVGWARSAPTSARLAAALLGGLGMLAFGVLSHHLGDGVPWAPLLADALHPSGPRDPDVLGAAGFALLLFLGPLGPRRRR